MDDIIKRFCPRYDFDSYEDMKQNFKILSYIITYAVYIFRMIIQFCFYASNYIFCRDSINFVAIIIFINSLS